MLDTSNLHDIAGLVLAGGRSLRMGTDKGSLQHEATSQPHAQFAYELLERVCGRAWVSVNDSQINDPVYSGLPTIVDSRVNQGPAAGLLSALEFSPDTAWLVLAVDMPYVTKNLLLAILEKRDRQRVATAYRHADGLIEPLCAIWEAHAVEAVRNELNSGRGSLRALAEEKGAATVRLTEPDRLRNINTPAERAAEKAQNSHEH